MTRYNNGHVDDGRAMNTRKCPNCGSSKYRETLSREECTACGLKCDYWGSGANEVYDQMMDRKWAADEREQELADQKWADENW